MQFHNMDWITQGAVDFIDGVEDEPFFLYFTTTLPHVPAPIKSIYADPKITPSGMIEVAPNVQPSRLSIIERVEKAGFPTENAPLTWLDDAIGTLIEKLDEKEVLENTIILFASDHGGNNAKMTNYEAGVRAPACIYWKGRLYPGTFDQMTANIDIVPTVLALAGVEVNPKVDSFDGLSWKESLENKDIELRKSLLLEITYARAVIEDGFKYMAVRFPDYINDQYDLNSEIQLNQEGTLYSANNVLKNQKVRYNADKLYPGYFQRDQLYNLSEDPSEQNNLSLNPEYKLRMKRMKTLLSDYLSEFPHQFGEFNSNSKIE